MPRQTYLQRRKNALSFRIGVPHDLRRAIGSRELTKALGTADIKHAQPAALILAGQAQQLFNKIRMAIQKTPGNSFELITEISPDELGFLNVKFTDQQPQDTQAVIEILQNVSALNEATALRQRSQVATLPATPPSKSKELHRLKDAIPYWQASGSPVISTVEIYTAAVTLFEGHFPALYAETIQRSHIREFIKWRLDDGKSPKTIEKEHGALRAVLGAAIEEEWIKENPASKTKLPKVTGGKPVRSYLPDECRQIFNSPVFTAGARPTGCKGEAAYWIPLLLLHTGARREEICQLTTNRIKLSEGFHYLAIDPIEDEGRLKTDESKRAVPVHDQLIKMGFLDYVEVQIKAGHKQLFHELKPNKRGQYGAKWGDWWRRYIREEIGLADEKLHAAHSFRHQFITECRRLNFREDYERALVGHVRGTRQDSHDEYGEHIVSALATEVNRIDFRALDLSHLWKS